MTEAQEVVEKLLDKGTRSQRPRGGALKGVAGSRRQDTHLLSKGGGMDGESRWRVEMAKEVCSRIWN